MVSGSSSRSGSQNPSSRGNAAEGGEAEGRLSCPVGEAESTKASVEAKTSRGEASAGLMRLLQDLKDTLEEAARTRNARLRESTVASIEAVLQQIRTRLGEAPPGERQQKHATSTGRSPRCSDISSVLQEVERSIRSLKTASGCEAVQTATSGVRAPALKLNSLELPPSEAEQMSTPARSAVTPREARSNGASYTQCLATRPSASKEPLATFRTSPAGSEVLKSSIKDDSVVCGAGRAEVEVERTHLSDGEVSGLSRPASTRPQSSSSSCGEAARSPQPFLRGQSGGPPSSAVESRFVERSAESSFKIHPPGTNSGLLRDSNSELRRSFSGEASCPRPRAIASTASEFFPSTKVLADPRYSDCSSGLCDYIGCVDDRLSKRSQYSLTEERAAGLARDRCIPPYAESGGRRSSRLSRIFRSLRSFSPSFLRPKCESRPVDPVELCSRLMSFCAEMQAASRPGERHSHDTYSREIVYTRPEAVELPQGTEIVLRRSGSTFQEPSFCRVPSRNSPAPSSRLARCEVEFNSAPSPPPSCAACLRTWEFDRPSGRPVSPQPSWREERLEAGIREASTPAPSCASTAQAPDRDRPSGRSTDAEILEVLKEVRQSMRSIESKQENIQRKVDSDLKSLLHEATDSFHASACHHDAKSRESEAPVRSASEAASRQLSLARTASSKDEKLLRADLQPADAKQTRGQRGESKAAEEVSSCGVHSLPKSRVGESRGPSQENVDSAELRKTLSELQQSIQAMERRDVSSPSPEVLCMLTEVRDSIRKLSTVHQEQVAMPPQPEVLKALEEIRATIERAEERNQVAQEKARQEVMQLLTAVKQSIHSIEVTSNERSALKNQQLFEKLNEMRLSVSRLEVKSTMTGSMLNPKVASLLGDIRASIRCMETSRTSQKNAAESRMMEILKDIKESLISIEGRKSELRRPNVNMFVLKGSKKSVNDDIRSSKSSSKRNIEISTSPRGSSRSSLRKCRSQMSQEAVESPVSAPKMPAEPPPTSTADPYVREALNEIRESINQIATNGPPASLSGDDTKYKEVRQSIQELRQEMHSLVEKQKEVVGRLSRESSATQLQELASELADIRSGMRSLIDTIPSIVEVARSEKTSSQVNGRGSLCPLPSPHEDSAESGCDNDAEMPSPMCRKVMEMLEEMKTEEAMEREVLRCVRIASSAPEVLTNDRASVGKPLSSTPVVSCRSERVSSNCRGTSLNIPVTSSNQLPSTFTLSFVGNQPQALDLGQPMIININGRKFKCSKM